MNKHIMIILLFVLGIGAAFYADDILAVLQGMGPLEALEFIFNYVLHAVVVTIIGFVVVGLPGILKPWLRLLQRKQRGLRRRVAPYATPKVPRVPRMSKDALITWLASQMLKERPRKLPAQPQQSDDIRLDLS
jgi:hypothetical protein